MDTLQDTFSKDDWIVHANYGIGQVQGKEKKVLAGIKKVFFKVKTFNGVYWLPVVNTNVDRIRPLASKYQISRALTLIRKPPRRLPSDYRPRNKEISQAIRDVSLYSKARMIRDLNGKRVSSKLNFNEKDALKTLKKQFLSEWAVVKREDYAILAQKLKKALETSIGKKQSKLGQGKQ